MQLPKNISQWSISNVAFWLEENQFQSEIRTFEEHQIDGKALTLLEKSDIKELIKTIGPRVKFRSKLIQLLCRSGSKLNNQISQTNLTQRTEVTQPKDSYLNAVNQQRYNFVQVHPPPHQQIVPQVRYHPIENGIQHGLPYPPYYSSNAQQQSYTPYNYQQVYAIQEQNYINTQTGSQSQFINQSHPISNRHILNESSIKHEINHNSNDTNRDKRRTACEHNKEVICHNKENSARNSLLSNQQNEESHLEASQGVLMNIKQEQMSLDGENYNAECNEHEKTRQIELVEIENSRALEDSTSATPSNIDSENKTNSDEQSNSRPNEINMAEESDKEMDEDDEDCLEMDRICEKMNKMEDHDRRVSMLNVHSIYKDMTSNDTSSEFSDIKKSICYKQTKADNKPSIESVTNRLALRERSKIFRRSEKKWHIAVNETSYQLVKSNPKLLHNKRELRLLAESEVRKTYHFAKGKSRSIAIPENRIAAEERKKQKLTKEKLHEAKKRLNSEAELLSRKMRQCHMNLTLANQQSDATKIMHLREEMQLFNQQQAKLHFRMDDLLSKERRLNLVEADNHVDGNHYQVVNETTETASFAYYPSNIPSQVSFISPSTQIHVNEHGRVVQIANTMTSGKLP